MNITRLSENTVIILFDQIISPKSFAKVRKSFSLIEENLNQFIVDIIISYASIHITFNISKISGDQFIAKLKQVLANIDINTGDDKEKSIQEIPVYYGPEVALDLEHIASRAGLSTDEVIAIHSGDIYDVYAIGFAPGFAYLGNVDKKIACPRKETPRKKIAKGSLGIADQQTAIYPSESPGGWQIVGKTPMALVDFESDNLTPISTGDKVRFIPITKEEYIDLGGEI